MYRLDGLKLTPPAGDERNRLIKETAAKLRISAGHIEHFTIIKRSLDARRKPEIRLVYSVAFELTHRDEGLRLLELSERRNGGLKLYQPLEYSLPQTVKGRDLSHIKVMVVGSGPAGLFCAYNLAKAGFCPIVVERGSCVEKRDKKVELFWGKGEFDRECNVQFGEGGAGTFSDGKLYTQVNDRHGIIREVLKTFVHFGADEDIMYSAHPHVGTDVLKDVVVNMRKAIEARGGVFYFDSLMMKPLVSGGCLKGAEIMSGGTIKEIALNAMVLCTGHSARDTYRVLDECGLNLASKPFAVGFRIQHPQTLIDLAQYGGGYEEKELPPSEYKLTYTAASGRGVYSFCMCPGGYVINASGEEERLCVNGMSYRGRKGKNANSAIVAQVDENVYGSGLYDGMHFQEKLESAAFGLAGGAVPTERLADFMSEKEDGLIKGIEPAIKGRFEYAPLNGLLPAALERDIKEGLGHFGLIIKGFDHGDALLSGVESRTSAPLKILRGEDGQSNIRGIYPCGEGAGYAGGITSAAADGIRTAEKIIYRYGGF
ncbi:MAG: FAD-dependent oxidoreductase [Lachnospiraceae bacterium]|nr:FAD-dependent oxidoreductase [Lachnospiraceae bacterium]